MTAPQHATSATSIDPATRVGMVSLVVSDLQRSLLYYTRTLGFALLDRSDGSATLGVATAPLLVLTEQRSAQPWPAERYGYTGLYHFAVLLPTRADLGRWLRHWFDLGLPMPGQADHLVSEAIYLRDPDGHGIEIYRDRPREEWRWVGGQVQMAVDPIDMRGLLAEAERDGQPWTGMPDGTRLGHMHLQVGDITQAAHFYHDVLGFDVVAQMPSALFVAAGGYHHHIGLNTWHSLGAQPAPETTARLRFFTIDLPHHDALHAVVSRLARAGLAHEAHAETITLHDPWRNTILLQIGPVRDAATAAARADGVTTR